MASIGTERVLSVHHWNDNVFSFRTTRDPSFRFENGHFVMLGMPVGGKPLMRAYSIASANHEEELEFLSIKVPDGPLTSKLQHIKPGDEICISRKPTGTLLLRDLKPGKRLYLLSSGTGLAPFMSLIKDPETYERFEQVVLVHGVRYRSELAYRDYIEWELTHHEYLGEQVRKQLAYVPTVTRQRFRHEGRITTLIETGNFRNPRRSAARSVGRSRDDLRQPGDARGTVGSYWTPGIQPIHSRGRSGRLRGRARLRSALRQAYRCKHARRH